MSARSSWYSLARLGLVLLCLLIVLTAALLLLPIELDITHHKRPIEAILTSLTGAPTTIDRVHLRTSLWPALRLHGVSVEGSGSASAPRFSHVGLAEARISLLPLARKEIRLKELRAVDMDFHVQRSRGQPGNWPRRQQGPWKIVEVADLGLESITVFLDDHDLGEADLFIDRLAGEVAEHRPMRLHLQGNLEQAPLTLALRGPTLEALSPQAMDFPLSVELQLSDLELALDGVVSQQPESARFDLQGRTRSEGLAFVAALGHRDVPDTGGFDLEWTVSNREAWLEIRGIEGRVGAALVKGALILETLEPRPKVGGRLKIERLDLGPLLAASDQNALAGYRPLDLASMALVDTELDIAVDHITGLDVDLEQLAATIDLSSGVLTAPAEFLAAAIPMTAMLTVDASVDVPTISAQARTENLELSALDPFIELGDRLTGHVGSVAIEVAARGRRGAELLAGLSVEVEALDTHLELARPSGQPPVTLDLQQTRLTHRPGLPLTISSSGRVLESAFDLAVSTAPLLELTDHSRWPIDLQASSSGAEIVISGDLALSDHSMGLDVDFTVKGDRLSDLHQLLGFSERARYPYRLQGRLNSEGESRRLELHESVLGRTQFEAEASWNLTTPAEPLSLRLVAATLDLRELRDLFDPVTRVDPEPGSLDLDLPILPERLEVADLDLDLAIARLLRDTVDLTEIDAFLRIRDGTLQPSDFSFRYGASSYDGSLSLDLQRQIPRFSLSMSGTGSALGQALQEERILQESTITARQLSLDLEAEGRTIRQLIRSSRISADLDDVRLRIPLPESTTVLEPELDQVRLTSSRDEPVVLRAYGRLQDRALRARLELEVPEDLHQLSRPVVPFGLDLEILATEAHVEGAVHLPLELESVDFDVDVHGEDLSTLVPLLGTDLPRLGPYRVRTRVQASRGAYSLSDLSIEVAESTVGGTVTYERIRNRPTFTATLSSPRIRLVDLLPTHTASGDPADPEAEDPQEQIPENDVAAGDRPTFDLDLLQSFDASLSFEASLVETLQGRVDRLSAEAEIDRGRVDLRLTQSQDEGQSARVELGLQPHGEGTTAELRARWSGRRYGLLADLLSSGKADGLLSIDLELSSQGSTLEELLSHLDGHIDFTDYPEGFRATLLDLWGGGLLSSVLPTLQLGQESRLNCTVGRFRVEDGVLTPESLLIDTTRSRIRGKGTIDLGLDRMKLRLSPRPKQRNLINLATPVIVGGSIADPSIRVSTSGLATTWFRLSLWVYTVWLDLLRKPLPADGSDVCVDPPALNEEPVDRP